MDHAILAFSKLNDAFMINRIVVTENDYQRLMGLIRLTSPKNTEQGVADRLLKSLNEAKMLKQDNIANNVITMNSRVKLKDLSSKREAEITITYPEDAEPRERRVSILSEIGLALLGRKESEHVSWRTPNGVGRFEISKVTYQPEAIGDYYL